MKHYLITLNGHRNNMIIFFENKKKSWVRLFQTREEAVKYGKIMGKWHGYMEVFPWEVFCDNSGFILD
jgi:hypothetical protein